MSRIVQLCPAAAGWRVVFAAAGSKVEDLGSADDDQLLREVPIACFALIEEKDDLDSEGDRISQRVTHVFADDFPSYLWVSNGRSDEAGDDKWRIGYLGPGEEVDDQFREEAREQIRAYRHEREQAEADD